MKVKNPLTLISWNVHGETGRKAQTQLAELGKLTPTADLIALQEVTLGSFGLWRDQLLSRNYSVLISDPELLKVEGPFLPHKDCRFRRRRNGIWSPRGTRLHRCQDFRWRHLPRDSRRSSWPLGLW